MFDLTRHDGAGDGRFAAGLAARSPRRWRGRARGLRCREAMSTSSTASAHRSAAIMWRCRATCRTAPRSTSSCRRRSRRSAASSTSSINNAGVTRDNLAHADEGRGVRGGHPDQPRGRVPADARRRPADDEGTVRADHLHHLGRRGHRQPGPGQLCRVQGGTDRHDQGGRAGAREPRNYGQRGRAGLHDFGDDRCAERPAAREPSWRAFRWARWAAARTLARPALTSRRRKPAMSRARRCT